MCPKRENMTSKSSEVVIGFSLQTKRMLSGGFTSNVGRSPIYSAKLFLISSNFIYAKQNKDSHAISAVGLEIKYWINIGNYNHWKQIQAIINLKQ